MKIALAALRVFPITITSRPEFASKWLLVLISFAFIANSTIAQIFITERNAQELVQNVLTGRHVQVNNIVFTGFPEQIASFNNGSHTNLGLDSGMVMTTGNATYNIEGPNSSTGLTTSPTENIADDPDLNQILASHHLNAGTNNVCKIEFDFIPLADSIQFNYIFGSEEYNEWVCSEYFDAFGFFLSGPGISGPFSNASVNLATVPGTDLLVGINTINSGDRVEIGDTMYCPPGGLDNSHLYRDNEEGTSLEMDGFTTILSAEAKVQCGQSYHIKLVIANTADKDMDSWVFLQAQSFTSGSDTSVTQNDQTFVSNAKNVSYQWIDCRNKLAIEGETNQHFTPKGSGNYAVIVSNSCRSDTSGCHSVLITSFLDNNTFDSIRIFPNPFSSSFQINTASTGMSVFTLYDLASRKVIEQEFFGTNTFNTEQVAKGLYFYELIVPGTLIKSGKLIKE